MSASTSASSRSAPPPAQRTPPGPSAAARARSASSAAAPAAGTAAERVRAPRDPSPSRSRDSNSGRRTRLSAMSRVASDARRTIESFECGCSSSSEDDETDKHAKVVERDPRGGGSAVPETFRELQFPVGAVSYASAHALRTHAAMPSVSVAAPARLRAAARARRATRAPAPSAPPPPVPRNHPLFQETRLGSARFGFHENASSLPPPRSFRSRARAPLRAPSDTPRRRRPPPRRLSSPRTPARAFGSWARAETGARRSCPRRARFGRANPPGAAPDPLLFRRRSGRSASSPSPLRSRFGTPPPRAAPSAKAHARIWIWMCFGDAASPRRRNPRRRFPRRRRRRPQNQLSPCVTRGGSCHAAPHPSPRARGSTGRRSPRAAARGGKTTRTARVRLGTFLFPDVFVSGRFLSPRMHAPRAPPRRRGARARRRGAHPAPPPVSNARVRPRPHRALRWSGAFYRDRGDHARDSAPSPVASRSPPRPRARPRRPTWRRWTPRGPLPTPTPRFPRTRGRRRPARARERARGTALRARTPSRARRRPRRRLARVVRGKSDGPPLARVSRAHRPRGTARCAPGHSPRHPPRRTPRAWPPHPRRPSRACPFWMPRMRRNFPV